MTILHRLFPLKPRNQRDPLSEKITRSEVFFVSLSFKNQAHMMPHHGLTLSSSLEGNGVEQPRVKGSVTKMGHVREAELQK